MARLIVKSPYIKCSFYQRGDSLPQRTTPLEPQENARGCRPLPPNRQCQTIFQRPYIGVFLLNDLVCFSFRSAAAAMLVRKPLQKASKPYKGSGQADIDAGQVESCNKNWQAFLCTARAVSAVHERAMAGQGRSLCGLGGIERGLFFRQEQPPFTTLPKAASNRHRRGNENPAGGLSLVRRLP